MPIFLRRSVALFHGGLPRLAPFTAAMLGLLSVAAQAQPLPPNCTGSYARWDYYRQPIPGVSWPAWSYFLNLHWTNAQMNAPGWYDAAGALQAAQAATAGAWVGEEGFYFQNGFPALAGENEPAATPDNQDAVAYQSAANVYHTENYAGAIPLFDKIVADPHSQFRAAAAYSAARSALDERNYADGFDRIEKIFADPAMQNFYGATYDLTGTLAGNNDDAQLLAARLNEIAHFLTAPQPMVCASPVLATLRSQAAEDILSLFFIADDATIEQDAKTNPVVDLAWLVTQRDTFTGSDNWIATFSPVPPPQSSTDANPAYTQHARDEWSNTKDPLWAYALSIRSADARDIPSIEAARQGLKPAFALPDIGGSASTLDALLFAQQVRILLMTGQTDKALQVVKAGRADGTGFNFINTEGFPVDDGGVYGYIADGGVRYFIQRENLDAARAWAQQVRAIQASTDRFDLNTGGGALNAGLQRMLAPDWNAFMDAEVLSTSDKNFDRWLIAPAVVNLLPADKLIALSDHPGLALPYRRALLSAGWVRLYMLGRWPQFVAAFPQVRTLFPELTPDLDNIDSAWLTRTKQRRAVEMLLRVPGLSPNVQWYFDRAPQSSDGRTQNIFSFDSHNPEDGNWWCKFDADQAISEANEEFLAPLFGQGNGSFDPLSGINPGQARFPNITNIAIWSPLFKDVDFAELNHLQTVENAPDLFNQRAVKWARSSNWFMRLLGMDEQLPETLHLAVKSTRYACTDSDSAAAFTALYKLYPTSPWTQQTPYWFNGPPGYGP